MFENVGYQQKSTEMKSSQSLLPEGIAKIKTKNFIILLALGIAVVLVAFFSIVLGQAGISFGDAMKGVFGVGDKLNVNIVRYARLPRIIAAILIGVGLAISGHVMQITLQNPLASPSSLGVSNAAVFGANLAIVLGAGSFAGTAGNVLNVYNPYVISVVAFVFAFGTVMLIVLISGIRRFSPVTVILLGVAFSGLFTALTTFVQYLASEQALASAVYWSFGDLGRASYLKIYFITACVLPSFIVFMCLSWKYNAIANGDELAKSLGVRIGIIRVVSLLLASIITAVCVSFVGIIGFIGVVCPQLMKRFVGNDARFLLPASGLAGSLLLLVSDAISRVAIQGMDLPVGAVTAVMGTPIFVYILLRREN